MSDNTWKLSPSDFAFLLEECRRCFYLKVVKGFYRPRPIMPKIFTVIDMQMKKCFENKRIEGLVKGIPSGIVKYADEWVESKPIIFTDAEYSCFIRGKLDTIVKFDDDSYGVIDFKTTEVNEGSINLYSRQLHAYAHALENPAHGKFSCSPISRLGLIVYEPQEFSCKNKEVASLDGDLKWVEIPLNSESFLKFIDNLLSFLDKPEPPEPSPSCEWCKYRENSRITGF